MPPKQYDVFVPRAGRHLLRPNISSLTAANLPRSSSSKSSTAVDNSLAAVVPAAMGATPFATSKGGVSCCNRLSTVALLEEGALVICAGYYWIVGTKSQGGERHTPSAFAAAEVGSLACRADAAASLLSCTDGIEVRSILE